VLLLGNSEYGSLQGNELPITAAQIKQPFTVYIILQILIQLLACLREQIDVQVDIYIGNSNTYSRSINFEMKAA